MNSSIPTGLARYTFHLISFFQWAVVIVVGRLKVIFVYPERGIWDPNKIVINYNWTLSKTQQNIQHRTEIDGALVVILSYLYERRVQKDPSLKIFHSWTL